MEIKEVVIELGERIPTKDEVGFRVKSNGTPVEGAGVTLCTKGVLPISKSKVTDEFGIVIFSGYDIIPEIPASETWKGTWLFFASATPNLAYWSDNTVFTPGRTYDIKLKKYTDVPKFFLKIQLRDMIGAELFGSVIASVESTALRYAGLKVVSINGQGTKTITITFSPPWTVESPIVIAWAAVWFILEVIAVAGAIIAILVVMKWTFGEAVAPIAGIGMLLLILLILLLLGGFVRKRKEGEAERTYLK